MKKDMILDKEEASKQKRTLKEEIEYYHWRMEQAEKESERLVALLDELLKMFPDDTDSPKER